ncbi:MAG TPA: biotin/lipoyl-containing protein [Vicinamibacterales bacterium]|nr:biotin/lipoyl-containing protein [Vicinamibacterales bacterium]
MTFEVELNGRTRTVAVERAGSAAGRFRVTVDGVAWLVDAERVGEFGVSLLFPDTADSGGTAHFVPGPSRGERLAHLGGRAVPVGVDGRRTPRGGEAAGAAQGEQAIAAPMPGRVVRVLVAPGDTVQARQGLVVVEAMKMENELRAPRAGRVKDVMVTPGTSVDAGRVLVIVE